VQLFNLLKLLEQRIEHTDDDDSVLSSDHNTALFHTHTNNHDTNTTTHSDDPKSDEEHTNKAEVHKHLLEQNMAESRTKWVEMCFSATAMAIGALLRQVKCDNAAYTPY